MTILYIATLCISFYVPAANNGCYAFYYCRKRKSGNITKIDLHNCGNEYLSST